MKKWLKKTGLIAAGVVALTSVVSAVPVSADVSKVVYFPIQSVVSCNSTSTAFFASVFRINVNNIGDSVANATLYLYQKDGTPLTVSGIDITPGVDFSINPHSTLEYSVKFGADSSTQQYESCSTHPAYGKIVVNSNSGQLMAIGEVDSYKMTYSSAGVGNYSTYSNAEVIVNRGEPF
ncbi:hypothetical protein [Cohnella sp. GbtcB17]|uniref:hypothetical protein n=1 Tax=Cohnella sp. GbtcB17 TaxID=2824762 RepID=UPI001C308ADC|nr:hypothetical protein [Cohnella sp. GbtcB17]